VRLRHLHLLTVAFVAVGASACGAEAITEELFAVPLERATPGGDDRDALLPVPPERDRDEDGEAAPAAVEGPADGGSDEPAALLEPDPADDADAADPATGPASAAEEPSPPPAEVRGPTDQAISRFVKTTSRGALDTEHLVADVTGDGVGEVLVGMLRLDRQLVLVLGRWDGDAVTEVGRVEHQGATDLGTLVVRDLAGDGHTQVALPFVDRPKRGVLVAAVSRSGTLAVPGPCPVDGPERQTFDFGEGTEVVELGCAAREVRGRDGLVWSDGVFLGAGLGAAPRGGRGG
jgi:hypothetical protein